MNKELEALERLVLHQEYDVEYYGQMCKDSDLVYSALERKEKLEKAWEIIKEKKADAYEEYKNCYKNSFLKSSIELLTENDFNLLKEMLDEPKEELEK